MTDALRAIHGHLVAAARSRRRRRASRHGASAISLVGGVLLIAALTLAWAPMLRPWLLVALASVALVGAGMTLGALLRPTRPAATAAWIARRRPDLGGAVADALEFGETLASGSSVRSGSDELAKAHVRRAADLVATEDPSRHALTLARPPWRSAGLVAAAAMLALVALPESRRTLLHGPPPPSLPRVTYGSVQLTHRHPAYLRLPDRVDTGTGDIEAPVGTHVEIRVTADRSLAAARISPLDAAPIEMRVEGDVAVGTLVVTRSGSYRIELRGAAGEIDPSPPLHVVRALPDAPPLVRLVSPRQDVVLDEGEVLVVEWVAEDDHGVAEAALVVQLGSEGDPLQAGEASADARRLPLGVFEPPESDRSGVASQSTADLGLIAGDVAWIWAEARDDDQVTGPKWSASSKVRLTVRSEAQEESALQQRQQEFAEELLALLAWHLVRPAERLPDAAAVAAAHREVLPRLTATATAAGELATQAQLGMEDLAAATALEDMRARLESLVRSRARRDEALVSGIDGQARAAQAQLHPREIEELERDVLFFDMWADRRSSLRAADAAEDILTVARELREAAEREAPAAETEELLALAAELAAATEALEPMLQQLADSAGADPAVAADAAASLGALQSTAQALREQLAAGNRSGARRSARSAEQVAAALAGLVGDLADAGAAGDPELAREIERAEGELRRLRREQADLRDETNRLRDEMRRSLSPDEMQQAEQEIAELEQLAAEAAQAHAKGDARLGQVADIASFFDLLERRGRIEDRMRELLENGTALRDAGAREMEQLREERALLAAREMASSGQVESLMRASQGAREMLGRLRQVIADRDLASAERPARWALGQLQALREDVANAGPALAPADPDFQTAASKTAEVIDRLEELERQMERTAQAAMTSSQRQQLSQLAGQQGQAQARARDLAGKLRELGADAPFLGEGVADRLDEAGGFMDDAERGLFGRRPGDASESQGEAMARLDEATQALSPTGDRGDGESRSGGNRQQRSGQGETPGSQRQGRGGQEGRDSRFGRQSRERVEIPDADAYKVPREFREEILEAMRESGAPDGYAEQVREYYRRLVE